MILNERYHREKRFCRVFLHRFLKTNNKDAFPEREGEWDL